MPTMQGARTLVHDKDDFKKQKISSKRIKFAGNNAELRFKTDVNDESIDNRFPLEGVVESAPLFVRAGSFVSSHPQHWVTETLGPSHNSAIEFRSADREDMRDAGDWESVGLLGTNDNSFGLTGYSGPFSTDDLSLSGIAITSGVRLYSNDLNAQNEIVYYISSEVTSGISSDNRQATYLAFDISCDSFGPILEMHVVHGLSYPVDFQIGNSDSPFKHLIHVDKKNDKQTVYWDITDWPDDERNPDYIRMYGFKVIDASDDFVADITNVRMFEIDTVGASDPTAQGLPVSPKRFVQYRTVISSTDTESSPQLSGVQFGFNFRPITVPNNMMRHNKSLNGVNVSYPSRDKLNLIY